MDNWMKEFPGAITICDIKGAIVYMNDRSAEDFKNQGGRDLLDKNLMDCHSPASVKKLEEMLKEPIQNLYTIEKNGKKKFICQMPWMENGLLCGLIEITMPIPFDMPHFIR